MWLSVNVARAIRRLGIRPDVVECPEWMAEGLIISLRANQPLVVRLHSWAGQIFPYSGQGGGWRGWDARISAWLEVTSAKRAHVVISTRSNLDEVAARMGLDQRALHAIPYPVRLPRVSPMPSPEAPRVTYIGRLEPRKRPDVLLAAAPKVLAEVPDARFVFVGRDCTALPGERPSSDWLRREAERLGISGAIELVGELDRKGVEEQLRRATVCAFPSQWESFGNVVAESAATGRPVVASDIPPFRELVADRVTGRIAPTADAATWATAVTELLRDRDAAAAMGRAAASHVANISEPGHIADLTLAAYEHAIERFKRGERAALR
jgi:glycosyltransferase involved in cell wall biosynthesis